MSFRDPTSWLWKLVDSVEDSTTEPLSDETMRAYVEGELSADEREAVENVLIRSSDHRFRLIEQAGEQVTQPPEQIRERLRFRTDMPGKAVRSGRTLRSYFAVAAVAASLLIAVALWNFDFDPARQAFAGAEFEVLAYGSSDVRSTDGQPGIADPNASVEVRVESITPAMEGLEFGLYRVIDVQRETVLERVPEHRYQRIDRERGAAWIRVETRELAGPQPGDYTFYVLVANRSLPETISLAADDAREELARKTGAKVYPVELRLLEPTE